MAGKEIRTDIVLKARTEGLKQAQQQAEDLSRSLSQAAEKATKGFAASQDAIQKFSVSMQNANRMGGAGGGAGGGGGFGSIAPIVKGLDELKQIMRALLGATTEKFHKEQKAQDAAEKRSFTHGFLQAALPSTASAFLSNQPGMGRQALGQMLGSSVAGMAQGISSMSMTGVGGLSAALQSIPFAGQLAGGALTIAAGAAGSGIARENLRLQLASLLYSGGDFTGAISRRQAAIETLPMPRSAKELYKEMDWTNKSDDPVFFNKSLWTSATKSAASSAGFYKRGVAKVEEMFPLPTTYSDVRSAGQSLAGMSETEAMQFMAGITSRGGGGLKDLARSGLLESSFAAKTAYGIGPETIGMFLRASRHGGIAGMTPGEEGGGGKIMVNAIADGFQLGLEGSDMQEYLQIMAAGIESFKATGIPLAKDSLMSLGLTFGEMGMGSSRALTAARGMSGLAQSLSGRGPANAAELMVMQTLGGFSGGGAADFENAQLRLEQGGFRGENMRALFSRFMQAGGGGAQGRTLFRNIMGGMGVRLGVKETQLLQAEMEGNLSRDQSTELKRLQEEREGIVSSGGAAGMGVPKNVNDIISQANIIMGTFGQLARQQADLENTRADVGLQIAGTVREFDKQALRLASSVETIVDKPMKLLLSGVTSLADGISSLVKLFKSNDVIVGEN